jgi:biotin transporter BioY
MIDNTGQTIALFVSGFYLSLKDAAVVMGIALLMSLIASALPVFQARAILGAR